MWKEDLPKNCPLQSINQIDGLLVYRLIATLKPTASDFECHWNTYTYKRGSYKSDPKTHCLSMGLSVYDSISSAESALDHPRLKGRLNHIATLELNNDVGVLSEVEKCSGHGTLWLYASVDILQNVIKVT